LRRVHSIPWQSLPNTLSLRREHDEHLATRCPQVLRG
jgi:hypothetical protein